MTNHIRSTILFVLAIIAGNILHAQIENSSERLITQLKNGTVPGLQFSTELSAPAPAPANKLNEKESLITQIRKGTAPAMKFLPVSTGTIQPTALRVAAPAAHQPLASEQAVAKPVQSKVEAALLPKQE